VPPSIRVAAYESMTVNSMYAKKAVIHGGRSPQAMKPSHSADYVTQKLHRFSLCAYSQEDEMRCGFCRRDRSECYRHDLTTRALQSLSR